MLLSRRAKDIILSIVLLALPFIFLFSNMKHPSRLNSFDRFILSLSSPVQKASVGIYKRINKIWINYLYLVNLKKENEQLRHENGILRANNEILEIWAKRGKEIEKLLGFKETSPSEMIAARVVSKSLSPYYRVIKIRINKGKGLVKKDDPVVIPQGIVGKVFRLEKNYADVILSVDRHIKIPVVVKRTGAEALLVGLGDQKHYTAKLSYLKNNADVKVGDLVVTSGMGGANGIKFPPDLPVGKIIKIYKKKYAKFQTAIVESSIDFSNLDKVLVVVTPPPPQDPNAPSVQKEKNLPRTGLRPY